MTEINLNLETLKATCQNCNNTFDDYKLSDFTYGSRLFYTESNKLAYANLSEDKIATKISTFINNALKNINNEDKDTLFVKLFCFTCDDINGNNTLKREKATCQNCHSTNLNLTYQEPPVLKKQTLPIISHNNWNKKSDETKINELNNLISVWQESTSQKKNDTPWK